MSRSKVRVRMYHVGFGDCFLLTFPSGAHMLVDCGVHSGGNLGVIPKVVADIAQVTGQHLQVVVATHRHQDHISGFATGRAVWQTVRVDEVWMPWTENPADSVATKLRIKHELLALELASHDKAPFAALAVNSLSNKDAMETLLHGFLGNPKRRYFSTESGTVSAPELGGVTARVLGPSRSEEYLKRMNPPESDSYLALTRASVGGEAASPFSSGWHLPPARARRLFKEVLEDRPATDAVPPEGLDELAFTLDSVVNNTSLMLLLKVGKARLLLPGDAQYGAWEYVLDRPELAQELATIQFYKVSHHGSHNGTPKRGVEAFKKVTSLVSTHIKPWDSIPRPPLLNALAGHGPVVRSDKPKQLPKKAKAGAFWIDYELDA